MKRIILIAISIFVATSIFVLCGCEVKVDTTGTTKASTTISATDSQEPTAIVELTNEQGTVVATEAVTMSANDKTEEENFFTPDKSAGLSTDVSSDRIQQALQNAGVDSTTKPDISTSGNSSSSTTSSSTSTNQSTPVVQDDYLVLRSNQYMVNARLVDAEGNVQNYKLAKNGKNFSASMIYNDIPMTVILGENSWYLLASVDKTYIEIPKTLVEQEISDDEFGQVLLGDPFKFGGEIVSEKKEVENGIPYKIIEYDNGNKDYFIGNTLIKTTYPDASVMLYDSISAIAPKSLFTPPADYTKTVITEDNASDIVGSLEPTDEATTHNHE